MTQQASEPSALQSRRYFGDWSSVGDVIADFDISLSAVKDEEVLYACYTQEAYEGSALVLFQRDGKLYEVSGSHCSCYGLEGQWTPEEVTWDQLAMRNGLPDWLAEIVNRHCPRA